VPSPRDVLLQNRIDALSISQRAGSKSLRLILERAEIDLVRRLAGMKVPGNTFTRASLESALLQVRHVLLGVREGIKKTAVDGAAPAAEAATEGTIDYLRRADEAFRGVGDPIALDEASMFERSVVGARSSILRRLGSSGTGAPGAPVAEQAAKQGILDRYGMGVIGDFEETMTTGVIGRKSWEEMKAELVGRSPFLQGKPAFWAERIVRTEMMGAYNRGSWESNREADDQLGDVVKILSATFDDRTGSDSYAVHGQIRLPDEAFESWFGLYQHPPNRPNDREVVVPHRISWILPPYLKARDDAEVLARWTKEKRKGAPPPRPRITTVPIERFGSSPPSLEETRDRAARRPEIPPEEG
jgi:hypothetical protein